MRLSRAGRWVQIFQVEQGVDDSPLAGVFFQALGQQGGGIAAHGGIRIKLGINDFPDFIQLQQGLAEQGQFAGNKQAVINGRFAHVQKRFADVQLFQALVLR
jgi:hypothetical protein